MKDRCNNAAAREYKNYGGRGITVCKEWAESFEEFFSVMGKRPSGGYSLDRIDNEGNYEPSNCKWSTCRQQVNNRRNSRIYTLNGESLCLKDWCRKFDVNYTTVRHRLSKGKAIEEALGI